MVGINNLKTVIVKNSVFKVEYFSIEIFYICYSFIQKDGKKHTVYEVIISVGSVKKPIDPVIGKEILRKFCDTWKERNPTLEMIGCYYLPCR